MDNQDQQPGANSQPVDPQPIAIPTHNMAATPQQKKPELNLSDQEAQAILAINNIEASQHRKLKLPIGMLITIAVLIVLVAAASYMLSSLKTGNNTKSANTTNTGSSSDQSTSATGKGVDNQVNQDVNSCSNVVNALSEC